METIRPADDIAIYRFPPYEGKHYGFNITVLIDWASGEALLIDTGYEEHGAAVAKDLKARGISPTHVVLSHFHPDHIVGLTALPGVTVVGSARYLETLREFGDRSEWEAFLPTRTVEDGDRLAFGRFELSFVAAPGHSPCSLYTLIDDDYIEVADNVMTSNDGRDILPWAEFDRIEDHVRSLEALRAYTDRTWLLSHGITIDDPAVAERAIDDRIAYFRAILDGDGAISFEEATRDCSCEFLHREWLIRKDA